VGNFTYVKLRWYSAAGCLFSDDQVSLKGEIRYSELLDGQYITRGSAITEEPQVSGMGLRSAWMGLV